MPLLYLFDIDGTLVHCGGAGRRALERACESLLGPGALVGIRLDGNTDPLILHEAFLSRTGGPPATHEADAISRSYVALLEEELAPEAVVHKLPRVDQVLCHLEEAGGLLGLATGNWRLGARIKLGRVGLWERFRLGGFGCDSRDRGELVRMARRRGEEHLGRALSGDEVLVIGDTPRDIEAAHAAGVLAAGVATGAYSLDALRAAGADLLYADLGGLLADTLLPRRQS